MIQNDNRINVQLAQNIGTNIIIDSKNESLESMTISLVYLKQTGRKSQGKLYDKHSNKLTHQGKQPSCKFRQELI